MLGVTGRYLHSRRYVENEAADHGFVLVHFEQIVARYQSGDPVMENAFIFRRGAIVG